MRRHGGTAVNEFTVQGEDSYNGVGLGDETAVDIDRAVVLVLVEVRRLDLRFVEEQLTHAVFTNQALPVAFQVGHVYTI